MTVRSGRRRFLTARAAAPGASLGGNPARAAAFEYRYAGNLTIDHPLNVFVRRCWDAVRRESGRLA